MPLITQANNLTRRDVHKKFDLHVTDDPTFFHELGEIELALSEVDRDFLDELRLDLRAMYENPTHEEVVKMFALAPVLRMAGLAKPPFLPKAEHIIEIDLSYEDKDEDQVIIRGRIDILITHENLWAIVIETKRSSSNVLEALPQALTYMMASKETVRPIYGLCTNGTDFIFVKLLKGEVNQYALSDPFSIYRRHPNDLYNVVCLLKYLASIVLQGEN
jgi:PD-(D/E)XK nuclease superfamily